MIRVRAGTIAVCAALHLAACQAPSRPTLPEQAEPTPNPTTPAAESAVPESPASTTTATEEAFPTTPAPTIASDEVFARLVARLETPACGRGENAASWRKRYAGHPARFAERLRAILPLLAHVTLEVERAGLPGEFALIPLVESWYQPEAIGVGGPAGMWQMVAGTARGHGIAILPGYDGRLSPLHSTRAALAHLAAMHARFGDWRLAAVGYNAGEYRAQRMASHNTTVPAPGEYRRPTGRSDVIHEYIGKLKALACLLAKPARHLVRLPTGIEVERLEALTLPSGIHRLDTVAAALEMRLANCVDSTQDIGMASSHTAHRAKSWSLRLPAGDGKAWMGWATPRRRRKSAYPAPPTRSLVARACGRSRGVTASR